MLPVEFNCGVLSGGEGRGHLEGSPWFNNLVFLQHTTFNIMVEVYRDAIGDHDLGTLRIRRMGVQYMLGGGERRQHTHNLLDRGVWPNLRE